MPNARSTTRRGTSILDPLIRGLFAAMSLSGLLTGLLVSGLGTSPGPAAFAGVRPTALASGEPAQFAPVGPLRLADSREPSCGCERLDEHTIRVVVSGRQGVDTTISAAALTVTATGGPLAGFVTAYPSGQPRPDTSTLNLAVGADSSNSTILPVGAMGSIDLFASVDTDMIVDITGVFVSAATAAGGRYQPVVATRLLDTRGTTVDGIAPGASVTLPLPSGVAPDGRAVVVNVTSVGALRRGYLSGYAAGTTAPSTSFLNPDGSGAARAASVILPVSPNGFTIVSSPGGHMVVDILGWFTGDSAAVSSVGLLVPITPTRVLDTRADVPRLWPDGTREIPSPVAAAAAVVSNVTSVDADGIGFLTAYPAGTARPPTSSLNAAHRNATTPNLAITSVSTRGLAYYSNRGTDVIVDVTGYFTGAPVDATGPVPPNVAPVPRALLVGDSTLGGLVEVQAAQSALRGFTPVIDVKPCRRLVHPSCTSRFTKIAPNTALEAINAASGTFDIIVIKVGYNDSSRDFAAAAALIVGAARAKGAQQVIWLTYSESTRPGSYNVGNAALKAMAGSADYPDLAVADWRTYAAGSDGWYAADRVHLHALGVWATADYIARWVAHVSHLPCPVAWTVGGALENPCRNPDSTALATATTPDLRALYGL